MNDETNPRILVTGAAGFIGAKVVQQLLTQNNDVVGIDNLNDYYDPGLKKWRLEQLADNHRFRFHHADIEDATFLAKLFGETKFDAVINLAARAGVRYSMENPNVYFTTNAIGNLNLLEQMRKHDVNKFVLASTSSLYAGQPLPFDECLPVNEPISPYAASKKAAEVTAYTYHHLFKIDVSVVRYFTVYGPAGRPDMSIYRFIHWIDNGTPIQLYGDGEQTRDFTFVDDIARGTIAALKPVGYEIINLGGGNQPASMNKIIQSIEKLLKKNAVIEHLPFHPADMQATQAKVDKAKRLLDWEPRTSVEEGLQRSVQWYLENRQLVRSIEC